VSCDEGSAVACHPEEPVVSCDEGSAVKERDGGFLTRRSETGFGMTASADSSPAGPKPGSE
jgi:hypothetical protein